MTATRNLLAGLANSLWSALVGLAVVPFYLSYLGLESYGLIGFYLTAQVLLQLLDMGMAATINREVARYKAEDDISQSGKLLHSLAIVYWSIAVSIAIATLAIAPVITEHWVQPQQLSAQTVTNSVMLMGVVLAFRWPIGLYQGALFGAQRITVSSAVNVTMLSIGSIGAIAVLEYVSPTIEAFFQWQICISLFHVLLMRAAAWRIIGGEQVISFDLTQIRRVIRFSVGVGGISIAGLVLMQLDKIILSKTVELESYGKYMLANVVASSLYLFIVPVFNTVYPRFTVLVARQRESELLVQYRTASLLLASLLFPTAMALMLLAHPLIDLWTGNPGLAADISPLVSLLVAAYALHGIMHMPYALMLAQGNTRPMFTIYVSLIMIMVPLTVMLSTAHGPIGGAIAQLLLFTLYLFIGTWVTHSWFLKGNALRWLTRDVGLPLVMSVMIGLCAHVTISKLQDSAYAQLAIGIVIWLLAALLSIYSSRLSRPILIRFWNRLHYR